MADAPRFAFGQLVHHVLLNYRGVIVDVHEVFRGDDERYAQIVKSRSFRDVPWYEVLPDGARHFTYVAENLLQADWRVGPIDHPMISMYFRNFDGKRYSVGGSLQ